MVSQDGDYNSELVQICSNDLKQDSDANGFSKLKNLLENPDVNVDVVDKDKMTCLMHAAYCGHVEACQLLLKKGADINNQNHSEGYTALMFAALAGRTKVVDLLLRNGAKVDAVNKLGKTAAQLGGFCGQHEAVQIINNFFSMDDLRYYTKPQGFEKSPKLDPSLLDSLHSYISTVNLNPVGLLLLIQSLSPSILDHSHMVCNVLNILSEKAMKKDQEQFAIKLHYLSYSLKEFSKYDGINPILKNFLLFSDQGLPLEVERFLRQSLKCFPYAHSILLKQIVSTLADIPLGGTPSTISVFSTYLIGNRTYDEHIYCSTCGIGDCDLKKCAKCNKVYYCGIECQKFAWTLGNHKRLCKKWSASKKQSEATETERKMIETSEQ